MTLSDKRPMPLCDDPRRGRVFKEVSLVYYPRAIDSKAIVGDTPVQFGQLALGTRARGLH